MRSGQVLQFPLGAGLDEDANAKAKPISSLKSGENIRWPRDGTIGKRWGTKEMPATLGTPLRFISRGSELSTVTRDDATGIVAMSVYDPSFGAWQAGPESGEQPRLSETQLDWSTLCDDERGVATSDIAVVGDYLIYVWVTGDPTRHPEDTPRPETAGIAQASIVNWRSGEVALSDVFLSQYVTHVRAVVSGTTVYVLFMSHVGGVGEIEAGEFDMSTQSYLGSTLLIDDARSEDGSGSARIASRFDACISSTTGDLVVVYERVVGEGSPHLHAKSFASLAEVESEQLTEDTVRSISICDAPAEGRIYVLYSHGSSGGAGLVADMRVRITAIDSSTCAEDMTPVTVTDDFYALHVSLRMLGPTLYGAWSGYRVIAGTADGSLELNSAVIDDEGAVAGRRMSSGLSLLSGIFSLGAGGAKRLYAFVADARVADMNYAHSDTTTTDEAHKTYLDDPPSISSYLIDLSANETLFSTIPHRYVGKVDHDIASSTMSGLLPNAAAISTDTVLSLLPFQGTAPQASFNWRAGLRVVRTTIDAALMADPWKHTTVSQESYISGSRLNAWDGRAAFDHGMRIPVILPWRTVANVANGRVGNGNYIYQCESSFRSAVGIIHRSPLSATQTQVVATGPNGYVPVIMQSNSIDCKQVPETKFNTTAQRVVLQRLYRTTSNGATLYELTYAPRFSVLLNDPTQAAQIHIDRQNDSDVTSYAGDQDDTAVPNIALSTRPQPYVATGELEDCQPPAQYTQLVHGGRIFLILGDRRTVWFSKPFVENPGIAPGFSPSLSETYEVDLTAMASMDEKRLMFWESGLFFVVGDGPTVAGTDNRFSSPQPVQSDVGCTNPRSVISWPGGVIFQSDSDLYNVTRGLEVQWIGKPARETLAAYPIITSAVMVSAEGEIRFTCNNVDGDAGIVLVFDYTRQVWFTRSYASGSPITDATIHDGVYYFVTDDTVRYEDLSTHLDEVNGVDTFVPSTVEIQPIAAAGPVGWQRVRIAKMLGKSLSNHALTIEASRDWATTYEDSQAFAAGSAVTTPSEHARAEVALLVQRRQAVGVKFTDAAPANTTLYPLGNGAGFELEGVALLVQPKPGLPRDTSSRRGG